MTEILTDETLFAIWQSELQQMRARMAGSRAGRMQGLQARGVEADLKHVTRERGLFTGLKPTAEQTDTLRDRHAIYLTPTGGLNVTAIADTARDKFCKAVSEFLR